MARQPKEGNVIEQASLTKQASKAMTEIQETGAAILNASKTEHETALKVIHQRVGRRQAYAMVAKLLTVADLVDLQNIKESKSYKGYIHQDESGNRQPVVTWEDFCLLVEGRSRQTIDNEILNLNALGPELFESMRTVGIGPGTMRAIRQLPEDKQQLIQQAVDTANKDDLAEFVEHLIEKHAKEKNKLTKKVEDLAAQNDAKERILVDKDRKINEQAERISIIKKLPKDERATQMRTEIAAMQSGVEEELRVNFFNGLAALKDETGEDHQEFIDTQLDLLEEALKFLRIEFSGSGLEWENS